MNDVATSPIGTASVLNALPNAILLLDTDDRIVMANAAAEHLFQASAMHLRRESLDKLLPADSPLVLLARQVRKQGLSVAEYDITLQSARIGPHLVDVHAVSIPEADGHVALSLIERTTAKRIDRQLTQWRTTRSIAGMAAVLAHEVRNPLSGIRGAAQLLEQSASGADTELTQLICAETDRIGTLVNRMDVFADDRPLSREPVNIHDVLEHVRRLATTGFARRIRITERYDPSLPAVHGSRDQLVQVFLNLIKNAAEALPEEDGQILLSTAYRHGWSVTAPGSNDRLQLPIMVGIEDNGPGIPDDLKAHLFEPFVTTKARGSGLGLALVAKIVQDHGGVVEVNSVPGQTILRVLLPVDPNPREQGANGA